MSVVAVSVNEAGYFDKKAAIRKIQFEIEAGELVGLIGPNGAGKSTIIKTILGLVDHVDGDVSISNNDYAYIPEQPIYYEELTLWEHIELAKAVNDIEGEDYVKRANELLHMFRLTEAKHHFPTSFSKGMQQKLMIIIALLVQPRLYIVDEPFIGLDPKAIKDFLFLLDEERKRGVAILMSTHVLDTAERICDRFLLVNEGAVIASGTMSDLRDCSVKDGSLMDCFYEFMEKEQ